MINNRALLSTLLIGVFAGMLILLLNFISPKTLSCASPLVLIQRLENSSPLRGFAVTTTSRDRFIKNGEVTSLSRGSVTALSPLTAAGGFQCAWSSAGGGAFDDPNACETIYVPPKADYDILRVRLKSSCGLPDAFGEIKISITP